MDSYKCGYGTWILTRKKLVEEPHRRSGMHANENDESSTGTTRALPNN
jgi:hypothetical protein